MDAIAVIDEQRCIGCALCIQACPVDAIVGAPKLMHTVVGAWCIGCELCMPPCPVDCIEMRTLPLTERRSTDEAMATAHRRHHTHNARLDRLQEEKAAKAGAQREERAARKKRETIAKAIERAKERLARRTPS
jgi:electron transport complex protein RnfB